MRKWEGGYVSGGAWGCEWIVEGIRALEGGCVGIQHKRPHLFKHSCDAISKRQKWAHLRSTFGQGRTSAADSARAKCSEIEQWQRHAQASTQSGKTELASFTTPTHLAFVFGFFAWAPNSWLKIFAEHPTARPKYSQSTPRSQSTPGGYFHTAQFIN